MVYVLNSNFGIEKTYVHRVFIALMHPIPSSEHDQWVWWEALTNLFEFKLDLNWFWATKSIPNYKIVKEIQGNTQKN